MFGLFSEKNRRLLGAVPLGMFILLTSESLAVLAQSRNLGIRLVVIPSWSDPPALVVLSFCALFFMLYKKFGAFKACIAWAFVESLYEVAYFIGFFYNIPVFAQIDPLFYEKFIFICASFCVSTLLFFRFKLHEKIKLKSKIVLGIWFALLTIDGLMSANVHYIYPPSTLVSVQRAITGIMLFGINIEYSALYCLMWIVIML